MTEQNISNQIQETEDFSLTELEYQTCLGHLKDFIAEDKINTLGFIKKDLTFDDFYYLNQNSLIEKLPAIQYVNSVVVLRAGKGILLVLYSDNKEFFENYLPEINIDWKMFAVRAYISLDGTFSVDNNVLYLIDDKNSLTMLTSQDFSPEAKTDIEADASLILQLQFTKLEKVFQG